MDRKLSEDINEIRENENMVGSMTWVSRWGQRKAGIGILETVS